MDHSLAAAAGSAVSMVIAYPMDTMKVRLQTADLKFTQLALLLGKQGIYNGYFRGMAAPLATFAAIDAACFGVYGGLLRFMEMRCSCADVWCREAVAGAAFGIAHASICCPIDVVKVLLQSQSGVPTRALSAAVASSAAESSATNTSSFTKSSATKMSSTGVASSASIASSAATSSATTSSATVTTSSAPKQPQQTTLQTQRNTMNTFYQSPNNASVNRVEGISRCHSNAKPPTTATLLTGSLRTPPTPVTHSAYPYFRGPLHCAAYLHARGGPRALYRGLALMLCRDLPACVVYFVAYRHLYERFQPAAGEVGASLLAGGVAGALSCATYPLDVVKSRVQADPLATRVGWLRQAVRMYREAGAGRAGLALFFRGFGLTTARAFLENSVFFLVYSQLLLCFL